MNLEPVKEIVNTSAMAINKHSPEILAGMAICGVVTTTVLAVRATPKALAIIEEKNINKPKEIIFATWKCYISTAISGAATIAAVIASNRISSKRAAVLASLYSVSEKALGEYVAKTKELVGEKKTEAIKDAIAGDKIEANPPPAQGAIVAGNGPCLCFDAFSGRYFMSDIENIRRIQNEMNAIILSQMSVSLNDLYYRLGLETTKVGDDMGWNTNKLVDFRFTSKLDPNGRPCLVVDYSVEPTFFYDQFT